MDILNQLSSKQGDKTEKSNKQVAEQCVKNPKLIKDIAAGLESIDKKLQTDCIEVFTMISESNPELIVPFADKVIPLIGNKETKTRWEAVHTLVFIADKTPDVIYSILPDLQELVEKDKSTIVRDYTLDIIANYAKTGKEASEKAFEILKEALNIWSDKHAKQVFLGFSNILDNIPSYKTAIETMVTPYIDAEKKVVASEAKKILKRIQK